MTSDDFEVTAQLENAEKKLTIAAVQTYVIDEVPGE